MPASRGSAQGLPLSQILAVAAGNALEFYDFLTFSIFSVQISHAFFPEGGHGLLYTLATFGVGFATRPLGGWIIGRYGDRAGRRAAMTVSLLLMGLAIAGVALTPSYARIGAAAPALLVALRLVQGFAMGGEVGPATAFLVEAAPLHRRGLYVSLQYATQDVAILVAGIVGYVLSLFLAPAALDDWGWRAAFLLGTLNVPFALWLRRSLPETLHAAPEAPRPSAPQRPTPRHLVVAGFFMIGTGTVSGYILVYLTTYAQDSLKLDPRLAFVTTMVVGLVEASFDVASGLLADRFGRRPSMFFALAGLLLLTVPIFVVMNQTQSLAVLYGAIAVLTALSSLAMGPMLLTITESLPGAIRSGTLATLYAVAVSVLGGTTQFVVKWLSDVTGSTLAPAWYLTGAAVLGLCAALTVPESSPVRRLVAPEPSPAA